MVLTLHVRPEGTRQFLARVFDGKQLVGEPSVHARVDEAIARYGAQGSQQFPGVTAFSIWYGGWSVGEVSLEDMRMQAPQLASRLEVLSAVVR